MLTLRPGLQRGYADHGWLQTRHSFSFARYFDPLHMQFRALRVLNEDHIAAGRGFGEHPHANMEILTCVLSGALAHQDSMGSGSIIRPGDIQRMYAGTGVTHSEFNASELEPVHLMQIWLVPTLRDHQPEYSQQTFATEAQSGRLACLAAPDPREGAIQIHADAAVYRGQFMQDHRCTVAISPGRALWLQVLQGSLQADGQVLTAGDGAAVTAASQVILEGLQSGDVLVFDLA